MEIMPDGGYVATEPTVISHNKYFAWKPILCRYKGKTELRWFCWVWRQEEWNATYYSARYMIAVQGHLTDQQYLRYKLAAN